MVGENADLTLVVCANRRYRILQTELARAGISRPGPKALALTDLSRPVVDWVALAKGFGVPACSVGTDSELAKPCSAARLPTGGRPGRAGVGARPCLAPGSRHLSSEAIAATRLLNHALRAPQTPRDGKPTTCRRDED